MQERKKTIKLLKKKTAVDNRTACLRLLRISQNRVHTKHNKAAAYIHGEICKNDSSEVNEKYFEHEPTVTDNIYDGTCQFKPTTTSMVTDPKW